MASSSKFDCRTIPQICVTSTGQKISIEIAVGIACCPKIPTPALTSVPAPDGSISTERALFKPRTPLKTPPLEISTRQPPAIVRSLCTSNFWT